MSTTSVCMFLEGGRGWNVGNDDVVVVLRFQKQPDKKETILAVVVIVEIVNPIVMPNHDDHHDASIV